MPWFAEPDVQAQAENRCCPFASIVMPLMSLSAAALLQSYSGHVPESKAGRKVLASWSFKQQLCLPVVMQYPGVLWYRLHECD